MKMQPQSSGQTRFQWVRDDLRVEYRECAEASQVARETSNCLINRQKTKFFILRPKLEVPYSVLSFFRFSLDRFDKEWGFDSQAEQAGETKTNHHTSSKRYHCHGCYLHGIGFNL